MAGVQRHAGRRDSRLTLKNDVLTFDGNVESEVFGGRVVGSNIRLQDPLGNFPRFFADVRARDLDLGLVTKTFEVGSITGKLEADVSGWNCSRGHRRPSMRDSPRPRATSRGTHQRQGGEQPLERGWWRRRRGAGVQSGVLKFFDEYNYDRLGIRCRLRGEVCEMSGVEPRRMAITSSRARGFRASTSSATRAAWAGTS